MPTSNSAFSLVAYVVSGVDADDDEAVDNFYMTRFLALPEKQREIISDFLVASVDPPLTFDLMKLAQALGEPEMLERVNTRSRPGPMRNDKRDTSAAYD